jgi:hypothetical protein
VANSSSLTTTKVSSPSDQIVSVAGPSGTPIARVNRSHPEIQTASPATTAPQ